MHACMHACMHTYIHTYILTYTWRWSQIPAVHIQKSSTKSQSCFPMDVHRNCVHNKKQKNMTLHLPGWLPIFDPPPNSKQNWNPPPPFFQGETRFAPLTPKGRRRSRPHCKRPHWLQSMWPTTTTSSRWTSGAREEIWGKNKVTAIWLM